MAHALNLVIPIGQDQHTQAKLRALENAFSETFQPLMDKAFRDSSVIHFARVFVIDDKYLVLVAEYDGPSQDYVNLFRRALGSVFRELFSMIDGRHGDDVLNGPNALSEFVRLYNQRSLGVSVDGHTDIMGNLDGYLFSAYADRKVTEISSKLE
ncbi:hypothetical protein ABIF65_002965 [Bradyrhizobium japonicum]|jgi:hypothetical protein|uniref:hypothetical protein n=1 Tax=Bradyrhizobium TaxID=374 RepID=UPI00048033FA|nr:MULTISPECIES: hypothetical protein [Bradyrhizobium]MBR0880675.1 hypothetical protein [Bradyrhizobium liaoningense]MBR1001339.1 hypothetical protein [Bradyrhizobium liaoningense]MBR1032164.1 hypothetical protein [Bradyrhizobium liaoningense]MBR1069852.1 hypothetical protein [Bradyrhizobium liaoningense]MCP1741873.1 hypothetical protein [Bradyrhizobium japonicum]